jgi:erythromycin esterase-like protein
MADLGPALRRRATPLGDPRDLDPLLDRIGDARFVLLGEASHGTSKYYRWRDALTHRLFTERGFVAVAVEGDWPDCRRVHQWIRAADAEGSAADVLRTFERWPTWANHEVAELVDRLAALRARTGADVGFYGLDVYSLWDSLRLVERHLERHAPDLIPVARVAFECLSGREGPGRGWSSCEDELVELLVAVRERDGSFDAEQNALVARDAERHYRAMVQGGPASWNVRDEHMVDTLERVAARHGADARVDARHTDMAAAGLINVGQRMRERHEDEGVVLVGFGSYAGSVLAGARWDGPMEVMRLPPALPGSWEDEFHHALRRDGILVLDDPDPALVEPRGHRAIGVVYDPDDEQGNYVPTALPLRYDAFVYLDQTEAVHPLRDFVGRDYGEPPETFPTGP